jgi:hypothetical protein
MLGKEKLFNFFKKERQEQGIADYVAQLIFNDTIQEMKKGNGGRVKIGIKESADSLKGPDGDNIIKYLMQNYLGFSNELPDERIVDRGEAINITAEELKTLLIAKFEKAAGKHL